MQAISAIKFNEFIIYHRLRILNKINVIISRRYKSLWDMRLMNLNQ